MKEKRTLLLSSTKKSKTDMQIFRSLPFTTSLFIKPYTKNIILNYQKLLVGNNSNLFIHKLDDKFIVGRSYNNEIIDFLQFEVLDWFADVKKYETGSKHILVTNFDNERMRNLFVDLFGFKGDKICIEAIKYVFETKCSGNLNDINFGKKEETEEDAEECNDEIRDVKEKDITLNLNMHGLSDSELLFTCKLRIEKYWFCDMKIFKNAIKVETDKKEKNVFTNEMGDVMGKIHMEKQELREIVIKKPRKVKNKE